MDNPAKAQHVIILCHPAQGSFNAAAAAEYCATVEECGQHAVVRDLYQMKFDPVLRANDLPGAPGFSQCPYVAYELDLIAEADFIVLVYPIWFGLPPAMLKGYVERVFGSDFSFQEVRDPKAHSKLKAKHLLSFTSSGNSQIWLEEQGQWQSLIDVFDHYLERAFGMASTDHVHFPSVTAGLSERFFLQHMEEVRQAALKACKSIAQPGPE